ncbi:MAG: sensor domain-containing diguanylate cyclase [Desulfatiglandaceae bacterium]|jgi:diguanylate cyclase (GGDEF)-like protein
MDELIERLERNEEIARRFFDVEVSILSIFNFKELFENLLTEIKKKFEIPYVWLSLIEGSPITHLIRDLQASELLKNRLNILDQGTFSALIGHRKDPLLLNDDLTPFYRLFPDHEKYLIRSLAITPITHQGEVIGSFNCGDFSPDRYQPGMDVSLLERLGVKLSICISNVTAHERVRMAASRDPLTGLINRRVMESVLKREFTRALRYNHPLALAFMDLDDFKFINDRYGHDVGDHVLRHVGHQIVQMSRESDVVARYAGDEFIIILPGTKYDKAGQMMNRLSQYLLQKPFIQDGKPIRLSLSFGIAQIHDPGVQDPASMIKRADERLYDAKRKGKMKERVVSFER